MQNLRQRILSKFDLTVTLVPLAILLIVVGSLLIFPDQAGQVIDTVRNFLGNDFGVYYLLIGLIFVIVSFCLAFSKYGKVKLGNISKPRFSTISWAMMIFTSTMAADILFFSLHEWMYYWNTVPLDFNSLTLAEKVTWSETYSLFHWGVTPWIFYILPAAAYAYMMFVKKRNRQKISEACRPIFGNKIDGPLGKTIDIVSVLALLVATSTTFTLATPLLSGAVCAILNVPYSRNLAIVILLVIALFYTWAFD